MLTREEFEEKVSQEQPSNFLHYRHVREMSRTEIVTLMDHLKMSAHGKSCLDIGPGYGETLDFWHEQGAVNCDFIDREPWIYQHNELKPWTHGVKGNHLFSISELPKHRYQIIYARGAFAADDRFHSIFGRVGLRWWLRQVEKLAVRNANIIMCPYNHAPRWMTETFDELLYRKLPAIEGHNNDLYPYTWVKIVS